MIWVLISCRQYVDVIDLTSDLSEHFESDESCLNYHFKLIQGKFSYMGQAMQNGSHNFVVI